MASHELVSYAEHNSDIETSASSSSRAQSLKVPVLKLQPIGLLIAVSAWKANAMHSSTLYGHLLSKSEA